MPPKIALKGYEMPLNGLRKVISAFTWGFQFRNAFNKIQNQFCTQCLNSYWKRKIVNVSSIEVNYFGQLFRTKLRPDMM